MGVNPHSASLPTFDLSPRQLAQIDNVGAALFAGRPLQVGHRGLVSIRPIVEVASEKGLKNDEGQRAHRSAARTWQGRQGSRGSPDPDSALIGFVRARYRAQVSELNSHYPGVRAWDETNGTWLAVRAVTLGLGGPQALFVVSIPKDLGVRISSWGFWEIGDQAVWIGHRHTNFPDGSICAFPPDSHFWRDGDALVSYVDLLSEWCFRQLFYAIHNVWPGPHEGRWRYYRLATTRPGECCSRCKALTLYEECCRDRDLAESRNSDKADFLADTDGVEIGDQRPHHRILEFASGKRARPPRIAYVHAGVRDKRKVAWNPDD